MPHHAISYYENDDGFPPPAAIIVLARALKVSTDELLGLKAAKVDLVSLSDRYAG